MLNNNRIRSSKFFVIYIGIVAILVICFFLGFCKFYLGKGIGSSISVVTTADIYPYVSKEENGNYVGFEIDLINHIASKLGKKVKLKQMVHLEMIDSIDKGASDCAVACLARTKINHNNILFSSPYLFAKPCLLAHESSGGLNDIAKSVSVLTASKKEDIALEIFSDVAAVVKPLQSNSVLLEDFLEKDVDFFMTDIFHARQVLNLCSGSHRGLSIENLDYNGNIDVSIMISKQSNLKDKIDKILLEMNNDGTIQELKEKWKLIDISPEDTIELDEKENKPDYTQKDKSE